MDFLPTIRSVLDIGCGADAWLCEYAAQGIDDYLGVDDHYVQTESLLILRDRFLASDLTCTFNLKRRFDLVQCLEVAEHLPAKYSTVLIDNISRHSDMVLFSATVPGQRGEHHVNEQPYEYWRDQFAAKGYRLFDLLRPQLRSQLEVEP